MKKKSRKVIKATKTRAYISKRKLKGNLALDVSSDSGSDIDPSSYYQDEIDDFHKEEDEKLSTDDELIKHNDESSEEEEVLPITDDEKDYSKGKHSEKSDSEDNYDSEEDLPNLDSWGRKKSTYYSADFVDEDRGRSYRQDDAEAAKTEEEGALAMQKSLANTIFAENFEQIQKFDGSEESSDEEKEDVVTDWNSASKEEKMKFLKKTSPELLLFIDEFKDKLTEVKDQIVPLLELTNQGKLPGDKCCNFLMLKYQLLMHYCMNISFYMVLKSQGSIVSNHPVLARILTYKKLLDQLKPVDEKLKPEIEFILKKIRNGEDIKLKTDVSIQEDVLQNMYVNGKKDVKVMDKSKAKILTQSENKISSLYMDMKNRQQREKEEVDDMDVEDEEEEILNGDDPEEKRLITYQISKNKGLIPYRKKEYRNPRVKNRMKFKRAKIRRKGQVREAVKELKRYDGEATGISTHVIRSIKLK